MAAAAVLALLVYLLLPGDASGPGPGAVEPTDGETDTSLIDVLDDLELHDHVDFRVAPPACSILESWTPLVTLERLRGATATAVRVRCPLKTVMIRDGKSTPIELLWTEDLGRGPKAITMLEKGLKTKWKGWKDAVTVRVVGAVPGSEVERVLTLLREAGLEKTRVVAKPAPAPPPAPSPKVEVPAVPRPRLKVVLLRKAGEEETLVRVLGKDLGRGEQGFEALAKRLKDLRESHAGPATLDAWAKVPRAEIVKVLDLLLGLGWKEIEFVGVPPSRPKNR
jgi:biopolymer transport protein ExbD